MTRDIIKAATALRPGTFWNLRGDVLEQADDTSARVQVPTKAEIDAYFAANPDPVEQAKIVVKDKNATVEDRLNALLKILGI